MNARRPAITIHWFRRDLRLEDNHALYRALSERGNVVPLFIFDSEILDELEDRNDRRVDLIHRTLTGLKQRIEDCGGALLVMHGRPLDCWNDLLDRFDVQAVYTNHDHEPYARKRDRHVAQFLASRGIAFISCKDHVIFEKDEVLKNDGTPYTVYTPYMRRWRSLLRPAHAAAWPSEAQLHQLAQHAPQPFPSLQDLGFIPSDVRIPVLRLNAAMFSAYEQDRDRPDLAGTSMASTHLRFGLVSVRSLVRAAMNGGEKYLNELIWREFYMQILWHFPRVVKESFKPGYDRIEWRNDEQEFERWSRGQTGYPLVDAGMRELSATGLMHNRVRMVAAGFLTKHLLIDWRWGEAWFARHLLDFELASNNGNWQWASGSGCDAAPYFRVFNPTVQLQKFDPLLKYVKQWLPGWPSANYMRPMIVHEQARDRAVKTYKEGLDGSISPTRQLKLNATIELQ